MPIPKLIQKFKAVSDVAGAVSDQELEAIVKLAIELKDCGP